MALSQQLVYNDRAQALSSDITTVSLYQILLGRDPENSFVIEEAKTQPIAELMKSFLASDEFANYVLVPIRDGLRLRHESMAPAPTVSQRAWIASLILLTPVQQHALTHASSWREFFMAFLSSAGAGYQFNGASKPNTIGRVEACNEEGVRGWALRLPITGTPVEVECLIGAYSVGRTVCDESRPELNELFGCQFNTGFTIAFDHTLPIEKLQGLDIHLIDAQSKTSFYGPVAFEFSSPDEKVALELLRDKVVSIERQLLDVKTLIDDITKAANQ